MSSSEERLHDQLVKAAGPVEVDPVALARIAGQRGRARRRRTIAASAVLPALAVGAVVTAVVVTGPSPKPTPVPVPAVTTATTGPILLSGGEPLLTCHSGEQFTPTVARDGLPQVDPAQFVPALQQHAKAEGGSMPTDLRTPEQIARADWRVAGLTDRSALILFGATDHPTTFSFTKTGNQWKVDGMGGCTNFRTVATDPNRTWADVSTGGAAGPLSTTSTTIKVNAKGSVCTDEAPRPVLAETAESVTLYVTEPRFNGACPAAARVTVVTITLSEPLRSRKLIDGSTWPVRTLSGGTGSANP